jgi:hypothetical protein
MNRHIFRSLLAISISLVSVNAAASDFNVLWVGLGTLVIACMLIAIGVKAPFVAKAKARGEVIPHSFVIILLVGVGLAIVFDEKDHMGKVDYYGMLGLVLVPGILAFLVPLLLSSSSARHESDPDE